MTDAPAPPPPPTVHASAIVYGGVGILIRGPSGAGKSTLAHALVASAWSAGRLGTFVADDRVALARKGGRLVARVPGAIAGLAELHGWGIVPVDHEPAAVVSLVVDLVEPDRIERMPEPGETEATIDGVVLARQAVPARSVEVSLILVRRAVAGLEGG